MRRIEGAHLIPAGSIIPGHMNPQNRSDFKQIIGVFLKIFRNLIQRIRREDILL